MLTSPSGRSFTSAGLDPGLEHQIGPNYEIYRITDPEPGSWQIKLLGEAVAPEGELLSLQVSHRPRNLYPQARVDGETTLEATSASATRVMLSGAASFDPDDDALVFEWRDATGSLISNAPSLDLTRGTGRHVFTLTVSDNEGATSVNQVQVLIRDSIPPVVARPSPVIVQATQQTTGGRVAARSIDLPVANWLASARAIDAIDAAPLITNTAPSQLSPGFNAVTFNAMDSAGNVTTDVAYIQVVYSFGGFQPFHPLRDAGRTLPVSFQLLAAGAPVTGAVATMYAFPVVNGVVGSTNVISTANNLFQYDSQKQAYVFHWATRWLSAGSYRILVTLDDGTTRSADVSL